jgi:cell fate regulator YaaT (PSP1 superfamily)
MAKQQNLSLNPTKISGICGRLMCCLKFESDDYDTKVVDEEEDFIDEEIGDIDLYKE